MSDRASPFEAIDLDLSDFKPQPPKEKVSREKVERVSQAANFESREPAKKKLKREPRKYRTGRDTQFNIKADPEVIEAFYRIAEQQNWVLGQTLEEAVAALEAQIEQSGKE